MSTTVAPAAASGFIRTYPLTPMQQGLLFHSEYSDESGTYAEQLVYEMSGEVRPDALGEALADVVHRHDALRTVFFHENVARLTQVVRAALDVPLGVRDLTEVADPAERAATADRLAEAERLRPFPLSRGPLLRVLLLRLGEQRWRLVWTFHHIVMDGWCLGLLIRDLFACYTARVDGREPDLPPAPQYHEFVDWLGRRPDEGLDFWSEYLAGAEEAATLPFAAPVSDAEPASGYRQEELTLRLTPAERSGLDAIARSHGTTLNAVVQAAWAVLLSWYGDRSDVVFGTVNSGRPADLPGAEEIVGLFINTLPVRLRVEDVMPFGELARRAGAGTAAILQHAHTPLHRINTEVCGGRAAFDHIMAFENYPLPRGGATGSPFVVEAVTNHGHTNYDFNLAVTPTDGLDILFRYNAARYGTGHMRATLRQFEMILRRVATEPGCTVADLKRLPADVEDAVLAQSHGPQVTREHSDLLAAWAARVAAAPDAPALSDSAERLSYAAVDAAAGAVSAALGARGVRTGDVVALAVGKSAAHFVAALGVLKSGAVFLPVDLTYPEDRIRYLVTDSGARLVVVADEAVAEGFRRLGVDVALIGDLRATPAGQVAEGAEPWRPHPDHPAYLIYTSGSTGRPKGTLVPHRGLPNLAAYFADGWGLGPGDRVLQFSSLSFDASICESAMALLNGAELVVADDATLRDLDAFHRLLEERAITALILPPAYLDHVDPARFGGVRLLLSAGSEANPRTIDRFLTGDRVVLNAYGPTEMTVCTSAHQCRSGEATLPIGRALPNTVGLVLDRHGHLLPPGVPGELCLTGVGTALGYLGRPELTAERFVPSRWTADPTLYRSGDLVRFDDDGELVFLGRIDNQVKIRGFRIELGEIEAVLRSVPGVEDACVVALAGGQSLHGFYVGDAEPRPALLSALPAYMVPERLTRLDSLPLTPNLKVDRRRLTALAEAGPEPASAGNHVEPRDEREAALVSAFASVLDARRFGIDDDFFERGGDSIRAIQAAALLQKSGWKMDVGALMAHRRVRDLAPTLEPYSRPVPQASLAGPVDLPPMAHWLLDKGAPARFNQAMLLVSPEPLDAAALGAALTAVVRHHDVLRLTVPVPASGQGLIVSADAVEIEVPLLVQPDGSGEDWLDAACEDAHAGFDLAGGPLVRARVLRTPAGDLLLLVLHHLVCDGVTWRILLDDLEPAYEEARSGRLSRPADKSVSQHDWLAARRADLRALAAREGAYWLQMASGPVDPFPGEGVPSTYGATRTATVEYPAEATRRLLRGAMATFGAHPDEALLAGLLLACRRRHALGSFRVTLEGHGRDDSLVRTCGWFTAAHPLRVELPSADPATALVAVKDMVRRVPDHGIGYGLLRYPGPGADVPPLDIAPAPALAFNYLGNLGGVGGSLRPAERHSGNPVAGDVPRDAVLEVNAFVLAGSLRIALTVGAEQWPAADLAGLAAAYRAVLDELSDACAARDERVFTPTDFVMSNLTQDDLTDLSGDLADLD